MRFMPAIFIAPIWRGRNTPPAVEEEIKEAEVLEGNTEGSEVSLLVFEARARERTALPLDVVERIESVPLTQIEYAGGRPMLQYRGELLTLRDEGGVLSELEAAQDRGEEVSVTVLICGGSGKGEMQRTGMVVRRVLDVSGGTLLEKAASSGEMELALVKEKLTMVHREFSVKAVPAWKEVA